MPLSASSVWVIWERCMLAALRLQVGSKCCSSQTSCKRPKGFRGTSATFSYYCYCNDDLSAFGSSMVVSAPAAPLGVVDRAAVTDVKSQLPNFFCLIMQSPSTLACSPRLR